MLDRNKPVQTRDGRKVTIYAWDAPSTLPIHGLVEGSPRPAAWCMYGQSPVSNKFDLINTPQTTVRRLKATPNNGFTICEACDDANLILQFEDGKLTRAEVV